jgi:hypothetical protein
MTWFGVLERRRPRRWAIMLLVIVACRFVRDATKSKSDRNSNNNSKCGGPSLRSG